MDWFLYDNDLGHERVNLLEKLNDLMEQQFFKQRFDKSY